jgi:hypothetical protein
LFASYAVRGLVREDFGKKRLGSRFEQIGSDCRALGFVFVGKGYWEWVDGLSLSSQLGKGGNGGWDWGFGDPVIGISVLV